MGWVLAPVVAALRAQSITPHVADPTHPLVDRDHPQGQPASHPRYVERRTHEGLSTPEIIRCLKRYVAREVFNALPREALT